MNIKELKKHWDALAEIDPMFFILSKPGKRGVWNADDFFNTGVLEIEDLMKYLNTVLPHPNTNRALDFGCGIGRLSQALTKYYDTVCGVDISHPMINLANHYNKFGKKCKYYLNDKPNLKTFTDNRFDLIYSNIVLQHMEPQYSKKYIKEFMRILNKDGVAVFQIPHKSKILLNNNYKEKNSDIFIPRMEMHSVEKQEILNIIEDNNCKIVDIVENNDSGPNWISYRYCCVKR
jgi:ubiquinone/menaquinone biosynthesis C-methylase UbiE